MYTLEKRKFLFYITIIISSILFTKFIFEDGLIVLSSAFKPFIIACVLIYLIQPFTRYLDVKTKLNRVQSVIVAYIIFIFITIALIVMIVPSITSSIISISNSTRGYSNEEFIDFLNKMPFISYLVDTSSIANLLNSIEEILIE